MSLPKEGSRDVHDGIIVSMVPDICLTPAGGGSVPVPYTIWCRQADAANLANSVRQTDDRSHAVASIVLRCYGDEPGTAGGIRSGTTGAECTPKTWSPTVRAEGRNMVRHDDEWWMNHRNTYGRLVYTKDVGQYATPDVSSIDPMMRAYATAANTALASPLPTQQAQAGAAQAFAPNARSSNALKATSFKPHAIPNADGHSGFVRVSQGCDRLIGTYDSIKKECAGKSDDEMTENDLSPNDHHIVPDYTAGGTRKCRENNTCRFDNMPKFGEMPAICLKGFTKDIGSEHQEVQSAVNNGIQNSGQIPKLSTVIDTSKNQTIKMLQRRFGMSDACADEIRRKVDEAFSGKDLNQHVRGYSGYNADTHEYLMAPGGRFNAPPGNVTPPRAEW